MPENRLDIALRYVRDAEENIARQTAAIAALKASGKDITTAYRLLRFPAGSTTVGRLSRREEAAPGGRRLKHFPLIVVGQEN